MVTTCGLSKCRSSPTTPPPPTHPGQLNISWSLSSLAASHSVNLSVSYSNEAEESVAILLSIFLYCCPSTGQVEMTEDLDVGIKDSRSSEYVV